jgi:hypothetical protein
MTHRTLISLAAIALSMASWSPAAQARDTEYKLTFAELLASPEAKEKLDPSFQFFIAGQATPKVEKRLGEDFSNRKTNGFGKEDLVGCRWAALSALLALQEKAKKMGANAVIDLASYYKKQGTSNPAEYECHAGALIIGVALKGTYATVEK